jgi:hypothetical protein
VAVTSLQTECLRSVFSLCNSWINTKCSEVGTNNTEVVRLVHAILYCDMDGQSVSRQRSVNNLQSSRCAQQWDECL